MHQCPQTCLNIQICSWVEKKCWLRLPLTSKNNLWALWTPVHALQYLALPPTYFWVFQPRDHGLLCLLKENAASSKAPSWHQVSIAASELWGKEEKILLGLLKRGAWSGQQMGEEVKMTSVILIAVSKWLRAQSLPTSLQGRTKDWGWGRGEAIQPNESGWTVQLCNG